MKLATLITLAVAVWAGLTAAELPPCRRVCQRREWRDLSPAERERFVNAIKGLHSRPSPTFGGLSYWEHFARIHEQNAGEVHNSGYFLIWHRLLLYYVEQALQSVDSSVCLPYWDWDHMYNRPEQDEIWKWLGGSSPGNPIPDGPFQDFSVNYPSRHRVTRGFDMRSRVRLYSSGQNDAAIAAERTYGGYSTNVEYSSHGAVHSMIGGDMITMHSNLDPLFYMHHGKVDYLYFQWQARHDTSFRAISGSDARGRPITLESPMPFFDDVLVGDVIDPANTCFIYRRRQNDQAPGLGEESEEDPTGNSTDAADGNTTANANGTNGTANETGADANGNTTAVDPEEEEEGGERELVQIDPEFAEMNGFDEQKMEEVQKDMTTFETEIKDGKHVVPAGFFDDGTPIEEVEAERLRKLGLEVDELEEDNSTTTADEEDGAYAASSLFPVVFAVVVSLLL